MTLNRWFVDYLYIPLGGSRGAKAAHWSTNSSSFSSPASGTGRGWTFILWGLWHGLFVCLEEAARPALDRLERRRAGRALLRVYTLLVVVLGFVMFRAVSVEQGFFVLSRMFSHFSLAGTSRLAFESILTPPLGSPGRRDTAEHTGFPRPGPAPGNPGRKSGSQPGDGAAGSGAAGPVLFEHFGGRVYALHLPAVLKGARHEREKRSCRCVYRPVSSAVPSALCGDASVGRLRSGGQ